MQLDSMIFIPWRKQSKTMFTVAEMCALVIGFRIFILNNGKKGGNGNLSEILYQFISLIHLFLCWHLKQCLQVHLCCYCAYFPMPENPVFILILKVDPKLKIVVVGKNIHDIRVNITFS